MKLTQVTCEAYRQVGAPWEPADSVAASARREWRYELLRWQWRHSSIERVRCCRLYPVSGGDLVSVYRGPEGAYFAGLQTCSSVWACPVCSAIIRQRRAVTIEHAAEAWTGQQGRWLAFLTLTVRHGQFERLEDLFSGLATCWRKVQQSYWWRRLGWSGFVRATEVTYGANGWHPHLHILLFGEGERPDLGALERELSVRWRSVVERSGLRPTSLAHGVRLQAVGEGGASLGSYLGKVFDGEGESRSVGLELARSDMKRGGPGLSPFELLDRAAHGDRRSEGLWHEYEQVTHGRRAIEWTVGFLDRFGLRDAEDEELVAEERRGEVVVVLGAEYYRVIARAGWLAAVLDVADRGDDGATRRFVDDLIAVLVHGSP